MYYISDESNLKDFDEHMTKHKQNPYALFSQPIAQRQQSVEVESETSQMSQKWIRCFTSKKPICYSALEQLIELSKEKTLKY